MTSNFGLLRWPLLSAVALLALSNFVMVAVTGALIVGGSDPIDWHTLAAGSERFWQGTLYAEAEWWYHFRWSPVAAPVLALVAWIGPTAWLVLHVVALLGLPGWRRLVALASYPFWFDVHAGNILVFSLVAASWGLRGKPWGIGATLVLTLLVPRPLMLPLAAWIVWQHPRWRWPFAAMFVVHALAVVATGYATEWIEVLIGSTSEIRQWINVAPSAWLGLWWMLAALPLAALAFWHGYPATSGLLLQPYWLPYYLLMPLADRWEGLPASIRDRWPVRRARSVQPTA